MSQSTPRPSETGRRRLASLRDAAEYAALSERTILRRIADGTIGGYRAGPKLVRVDLNEIDEKLVRRIPTTGSVA